jgi:hypothetical protein
MQLVLTLFYFLLFCLAIRKMEFFRSVPGITRNTLILFFAAKVAAGTFLILIYTYFYTDIESADIYKYFQDGRVMYSALKENPADYLRMMTGIDASSPHLQVYYDAMSHWYRTPWDPVSYNDSRLVIRFNALAFLISGGSIYVHNVLINFLSFGGILAMYRFFARYSDPRKLFWLAPGMFLFPGLLFWGSGILKEGLLLWAFGFWIFHFDRILSKPLALRGISILALLFFSFILLQLKPYTIGFWIPCMIGFYISCHVKNALKTNLIYGLILLTCVVGVLLLRPYYDLVQIIVSKQNDFISHSRFEEAGSLIHTELLSANWISISKGWLIGLMHTFTRPHLLDVSSPVILMAALENLLIWACFIAAVIFPDKKLHEYPVKWSGIWFTVLLFGFVGMISVAYGGIVRYKIPALPFLWVFFVHVINFPNISWSDKGIKFLLKKRTGTR